MPQVAAGIQIFLSASLGVSVAAGSAIGALVVKAAVFTGFSKLLSSRNKAGLDSSLEGINNTIMVKQPITPRRIIYGEERVSGPISFIETTDDGGNENAFLHIVVVLAGHEVQAINNIYFNDELVPLDGSGNATGKYANFVRIKKHLGSPTQVADSDLVSETSATNTKRWQGNAYIYARLKKSDDLFIAQIPNISADAQGKKVYDNRTASTVYSTNPALCISDYLQDSVLGLGTPQADIDATAWDEAANICDETVNINNRKSTTFTANASTEQLTLAARLGDLNVGDAVQVSTTGTLPAPLAAVTTYYIIKVDPLTVKLATSLANAESSTAIDITDTGTGTHTIDKNVQPKSSDFTADTSADELTLSNTISELKNVDGVELTTSGTLPAPLATGTTYYIIMSNALTVKLATSAANALAGTAIDITTTGSGTHNIKKTKELRYTCNGVIDTSEAPVAAIEKLLSAMEGTSIWAGGQWFIHAGAHRTPTVTLDESDLVAPITVKTKQSRRANFNSVKGLFVGPDNNYQPQDFPSVTNATYLSEDSSERAWLDMELPFTNSASMAQRLAKIALEKSRQGIEVSMTCKLTAYGIQAGDTIYVKNTRMGWTGAGKQFTVTGFELADVGDLALGCKLDLRETASGVWDWNDGEETTIDLAPNTNLPDPFTVAAPTGVTLKSGTAQLFEKLDGTIVSRLKVSWTVPTNQFISRVEIQFKKTADSDWEAATPVPSSVNFVFIWDIEEGVNYHARIRFVNNLGVRSAWSTSGNHNVAGKSALPTKPTGFALTPLIDGIKLTWVNPSDGDLLDVEIASGAAVSPTTHLAYIDGESHIDNLDFGTTRYYRIRARNRSGNVSAWTSSKSAIVGNVSMTVGSGTNLNKQTKISPTVMTFGSRIKFYEIASGVAGIYFNPTDSTTADRLAITASSSQVQIALGASAIGGNATLGYINSAGEAQFRGKVEIGNNSSDWKLKWNGTSDFINIDGGLKVHDAGSYNYFEAGVTTAVDVRGVNLRIFNSGGTQKFRVNNTNGSIYVQSTKVVETRKTGWGAPTGTATRSTFATSTVTLSALAERVHALIDDLTSHGLIGS